MFLLLCIIGTRKKIKDASVLIGARIQFGNHSEKQYKKPARVLPIQQISLPIGQLP